MIKKTARYLQVENALPLDVRTTFQDLVEEYMTSANDRLPRRRHMVHYEILSDLALSGWRKTGPDRSNLRVPSTPKGRVVVNIDLDNL